MMLILFIITAMSGGGKIGAIAGFSFLGLVFGVGVLGFIFIQLDDRKEAFAKLFKAKIITKIVSFYDEQFTYNATEGIPSEQFINSCILKQYPDRYASEDLVEGKLGATEFKFSEVHAEEKFKVRDSDGKDRTQFRTLFKGLFFVADFNKPFRSRTIVLPDTAERLFGNIIGKTLQSWGASRGEQLVKLEDIEFEKHFVVYSEDQIDARYILSTSLMRRVVDFKKKFNKVMYFSFVESKIYVAIPYNRNLFEPRVDESILNFSTIQEYFDDIALVVGLVEDLNLNTRIWGTNGDVSLA
jgi:hypothetical protein